MLALFVGITVAIGGKVLDLLYGAEQPFEFTGSTTPEGR